MIYLTEGYGVEFAQVYHLGPGKNGGGGIYILYSGDVSSVSSHIKIMINGSGQVLFYRYDHGGRLTSVADEVGEIVSYRHTPGGKVKEIRHLNGDRTAKKGAMLLPDHPGGLSTQIRDIRYRYDRMGRLTAESRDGEETSYLYDLCGNRLEKRKGGGPRKEDRYDGEGMRAGLTDCKWKEEYIPVWSWGPVCGV